MMNSMRAEPRFEGVAVLRKCINEGGLGKHGARTKRMELEVILVGARVPPDLVIQRGNLWAVLDERGTPTTTVNICRGEWVLFSVRCQVSE